MEYVELPIFDENGFDTGKRLKINTRYFLGAAGAVTAHRDIEVVKPDPVAEEMEMVERIISGLPPKPGYVDPITFERPKGRLETIRIHDNRLGSIELVDVVHDRPEPKLRIIPGFGMYLMDAMGRVYDKDHKTIPIVKGSRFDNVLLKNDEGIQKRMAVDFLFRKTFPEYK